MPRFVIERDLPGASRLSPEDLKQIAAKSNEVVKGLGVPYTWVTVSEGSRLRHLPLDVTRLRRRRYRVARLRQDASPVAASSRAAVLRAG
jgi:hypothetical protein